MTRRYAGQPTGQRTGRPGARELTVVTAAARMATVALALMLGAAACSSPVAGLVGAPPVAVETPRSIPTTPSQSTTATHVDELDDAATGTEATTMVTEVVAIPFPKQTVEDGALAKGTTLVRTVGRDGRKTITWLVRTRGGVEVNRTVSGEQITRQPVPEVTAVGTKAPVPASTPAKPTPSTTATASPGKCDPNYSGACVPVASDVDCAGGSGNGPAYVQGPVQVVGRDIYGLDADHDGIGCEKG